VHLKQDNKHCDGEEYILT